MNLTAMQILASATTSNGQTLYSDVALAQATLTLASVAPLLVQHAPWAFDHALSLLLHAYQVPSTGLGQKFLYHGPAVDESKELKGVQPRHCLQLIRLRCIISFHAAVATWPTTLR